MSEEIEETAHDESAAPDEATDALESTEQPPRARALPVKWIALLVVALVVGVLIGRAGGDAQPSDHGHDHATESAEPETWTCSMHPQIQAPEPGACAICGMDLIPASSMGSSESLEPEQLRLSARAKALARIRTTEVATAAIDGEQVTLSGQVAEDEATLRAVTTWIGGRVDRLMVSTTGETVRRGQPLARMYSPEVYAAHNDLLVARGQLEELSSADAFAQRAANAQLESARQRLRLLGFSSAELEKMQAARKPWTQVTIRSTAAGTVLRRNIKQGQFAKAGEVLFEIADLAKIWVELDAYEADMEHLAPGQRVDLQVDALPGRQFVGTIDFIDPVADSKTRVITVRVDVENEGGVLKPGMSVRATSQRALVEPGQPLPLVIPHTAPLFAGERALVYVERRADREGSIYEAREVSLGGRVGDVYPILAGLSRGERVVTHGAFTLDADLQIRSSSSLMGRPDDKTRKSGPSPISLSPAQHQQLAPVLSGYLDVQESLAADSLEQALERTKIWSRSVQEVTLEPGDAASAWGKLVRELTPDIEALDGAKDIDSARRTFSFLTRTMDRFLVQFGNLTDSPLRLAYCPMAKDNNGDYWYQRASTVDNVYFGNQMRQCGEIKRELGPDERLLSTSSQEER